MQAEWQDWQVPPFAHYISVEDQILTLEAQETFNYLTKRVLVPAASHIAMLLDEIAYRKLSMVHPPKEST